MRGHAFTWFSDCVRVRLCVSVQVLHADIKTGNIFLDKSHTVAKIADYGLSKCLQNSVATHTFRGMLVVGISCTVECSLVTVEGAHQAVNLGVQMQEEPMPVTVWMFILSASL